MALDLTMGAGDIIGAGINMYSANAVTQKNIDWEKEKAP